MPIAGSGFTMANPDAELLIRILVDSSTLDAELQKTLNETRKWANGIMAQGREVRSELKSYWTGRGQEEKASASYWKSQLDDINMWANGLGKNQDEVRSELRRYWTDVERTNMKSKRGTEALIKANQRFKGEWMSLMFAGMGLIGIFQSYISNVLQMLGVTDMISILMTSFLLPVMKDLLPVFIKLFKFLMRLPTPVKYAIGVIMLLVFGLGTMLMIIGAVALAISGLGVAIANAGFFFWLMILGGIVMMMTALILLVNKLAEEFDRLSNGSFAKFADVSGNPILKLAYGSGVGGGTNNVNSVNVNANVGNNVDIDLLARRIFGELQVMQGKQYG